MSTEDLPADRVPADDEARARLGVGDAARPGPDGAGPGSAPRRLGFGGLVGIVIGALALGAVGLGAAGAAAPPRVSSVAVAPDALVSRSGQRVVLTLNQPVAADELRLTISPDVPTELSAEGAVVTVRFDGMLDYATDYRIVLDGVRGTATGAAGRVEASFTTPDESVLLIAGDAAGEQVVRASATSGASPEVLYRALRIAEAVRVGDGIAVISDEGDGPAVRQLAPDAAAFVLGGPAEASYRALHSAPDGRGFGYVMTSPDVGPEHTVYDSVLFLVDAATGIATEVLGFDGTPIPVADWSYVRGTSSILVRSADQQGYLVDTTGGDPVPLGTLGLLRGFVPGTTTVLSDHWPDTNATELTTGETTLVAIARVPVAEAGGGAVDGGGEVDTREVVGDFAALGGGEYARLVHVFVGDPQPRWSSSVLWRAGADGASELFRPPAGTITGMCVSPNAQLLALTVIDPQVSDAAPLSYIVDSRTGSTIRTVAGARADWCALD